MQHFTSNPLGFIRFFFMTIGVVFFVIIGMWSVAHLEDMSMVRGTADPQQALNVTAVLSQ